MKCFVYIAFFWSDVMKQQKVGCLLAICRAKLVLRLLESSVPALLK